MVGTANQQSDRPNDRRADPPTTISQVGTAGDARRDASAGTPPVLLFLALPTQE